MKKDKSNVLTLAGYVLFFMTIAITVTVALSIYEAVKRANGESTSGVALIMLAVIVVLSILCTLADILRRKIMIDRPVRKILDATNKMTSGDFSVRLKSLHLYEGYDSYDLIMENLNILAESLEQSEVLKTDFISNVSHEIKTPLAVIQSYAKLLKKEKDEELRNKYIDTLISATEKLTALVSNILKLNKLENQTAMQDIQEIKLDELIAETVLNFEEIIENKGLELDCNIKPVTIKTSTTAIEIVMNNLLSNAIKFTEKGGKIGVYLKESNGNAVITVTDTGCGISKEIGAKIFDKFYQADTSHSVEGNGLGLALVKKVIDVLGGNISVESEIGKGSTFSITLKGI